MKYEFIIVDEDTTKLKYKDKEFEIKKTIGLLEKLQKVNYNAKLEMMKALKERGETANDYIVKRMEGNKTYEDKSNLIELEQYFVGLESQKLYDDILKETTNMSYAELLVDIGVDYENPEEVKKFTIELTKALTTNKTPSEEVL